MIDARVKLESALTAQRAAMAEAGQTAATMARELAALPAHKISPQPVNR